MVLSGKCLLNRGNGPMFGLIQWAYQLEGQAGQGSFQDQIFIGIIQIILIAPRGTSSQGNCYNDSDSRFSWPAMEHCSRSPMNIEAMMKLERWTLPVSTAVSVFEPRLAILGSSLTKFENLDISYYMRFKGLVTMWWFPKFLWQHLVCLPRQKIDYLWESYAALHILLTLNTKY